MQLTAPSFLFIAFPIFTAMYAIVPKSSKKLALAAFCPLVYMLANIYNPFALIFLVLTVTAVYFGTKWIDMLRGPRRTAVAAVFISVLVETFVLLRVFSSFGLELGGIKYPFGASVWLLCAISCIIDVKRGDAPPPTPIDAVLYISYFPVMLVGPIVKYRDSLGLFRTPELSLDKLARGAEYFMLGIVKIFAITLPLLDILKAIAENIEMGIGVLAAIEFIFLINICVYSAFSGYSDMASGVSLIWGIELPKNFARPFTAASPLEFIKTFMITLYDYISEYLFLPLAGRKKGKLRCALAFVACFVAVGFWFRSSLFMPVFALACSAVLAAFFVRPHSSRTAPTALRVFGYVLTPILTALFWSIAVMPAGAPDLDLIVKIFESFGRPGSISVLGGVSAEKYIFILLCAVFTILISDGGSDDHKKSTSAKKIISNGILLLIFVCTVFFIFPQYPQVGSFLPFML